MTVVQILPALNAGGVERGTVELAGELVRRGHRAIVVSAGGRMEDALRDAGAEHIRLSIGAKHPFTLRHVATLRRLLTDTGADILHARSRLPGWVGWLAWRGMDRDRRPRFVTTVHGPYTVNRYSRIMTRGERVIAISQFIRDYILANYPEVDPGVIRVIPRGVSAAQFPRGYRPGGAWLKAWREQHPALAGKMLITLPARITRWKGQQDFIEVIAELRRRGLPIHGLVVGDAEGRRRRFLRELRQQVKEKALDDVITFTGHRDDLREIMATSSLVMSLAREPEAFGRASLEALSLGVPVVAYDHGGAAEILRELFPAGLVPAGKVSAAADLAAAFCAAPPEVTRPVSFTLQRTLAATLGVYEELLSGSQLP